MKNLILLAAVWLLFVGCGDEKKSAAAQAPMAQMPPVSVKSHIVKFEKVDFTKSYSALLKPYQEVEVVARVSGVLVKENFTEGAFVKEGQTLYEIQKDEYKAALAEAKASLLKAEANFNKASKDWTRAEFLFKNSAMSEQQKDELFYAHQSMQAEVEKAKATVANAELNYGYATIKAPISGIVGLSGSDEGSYINVDAQNAKLTTITAIDKLYAEFSVPSDDALKYALQIKNGTILTLNMGVKKYSGKVDFIAPTLDSKTDTLLVRAIFENPNRELLVGSYAEVTLGGFSYENVAKIPQGALVKTPDAMVVYLIENESVSMRPIKVLHVEDGVAMVESGVRESDVIAVSNIAKLRPSSKVSIVSGE